MTGSSSWRIGPGGLVLAVLRVRTLVFSVVLSFLGETVAVPRAEPRLVTRPNSSEISGWGLRDVEVVRFLENKLGMGELGTVGQEAVESKKGPRDCCEVTTVPWSKDGNTRSEANSDLNAFPCSAFRTAYDDGNNTPTS